MAKQSLLREFLYFLKKEKVYWIVPLVIILILIVLFALFSESSPLAPFLYPLM